MHNHHFGIDVTKRYDSPPEGFLPRTMREDCPYAPNDLIELLILTPEGYGSTGVTRPRFHDWKNLPKEVTHSKLIITQESEQAAQQRIKEMLGVE